ncbi:MAG: hypothetical protein HFH84_13160 [Lachnospiraceae bacterium]|jgi:hypothetical protein|nr:hypothetical protein [Lachnospiraceae bacterium]
MRLIDADKIEINEECTFSGKGIKVFLDAIPAAYDVDKVMEQLRKNHDVEKDRAAEYDEAGRLDLMDEHDAKAAAYRNAIKIVKSGGIE